MARRPPLKGGIGGTPALQLPGKSTPCSVPQFLRLPWSINSEWNQANAGRASVRLLFDGQMEAGAASVPRACVMVGGTVPSCVGAHYLRVTATGQPRLLLSSSPKLPVFYPVPLSLANLKASRPQGLGIGSRSPDPLDALVPIQRCPRVKEEGPRV